VTVLLRTLCRALLLLLHCSLSRTAKHSTAMLMMGKGPIMLTKLLLLLLRCSHVSLYGSNGNSTRPLEQ
jgi:hypothetical protein